MEEDKTKLENDISSLTLAATVSSQKLEEFNSKLNESQQEVKNLKVSNAV